MDNQLVADLLFPEVTLTPAELETKYPERILPEGAKVTRFSPSPTGFLHLGAMYQAMINERLANQSGGLFYLRIEDTDAKRKVEGAEESLIQILSEYQIFFDEGVTADGEKGDYGPYTQTKRKDIYHVYAKELVKKGLAYPCFDAQEEEFLQPNTDTIDWEKEQERKKQQKIKWRSITLDDIQEKVSEKQPFVLRIRSADSNEQPIIVNDLLKGKLEFPANDEDFVLLKSDGIPTYHFAHAVDDHLMRTTHVIRGEEWLSSLPKHVMLFQYLNFKMPKYLHTAQLLRLDENGNKKKLSKRDMGANMEDYKRLGYAPACVIEYLLTILNSNYEEWHSQHPDKTYLDFPFSIKKMNTSGALFDMNKLQDVSKNVLSKMTAKQIFDLASEWARLFDPSFYALLQADIDYAIRILNIGRGGKKPRKDFATFAELKNFISFFYDELFQMEDTYPTTFDHAIIKEVLIRYLQSYQPDDDQNIWFDKMKQIAETLGFASDMKAFKAQPDLYKGSIADISMFIRVAVTGRMNSPDLFEVIQIIGSERMKDRILAMIEQLAKGE
ncbi:MAG: glutamate--tRNA ligase [Clostridiales bacterium]|nr:glutamate--tRNA ligase [Clostridiales bacterium]